MGVSPLMRIPYPTFWPKAQASFRLMRNKKRQRPFRLCAHARFHEIAAMEIEVFRAGNPAAAAAGITAADLLDVASFDCVAHPVPNVVGHPRNDSPAADRVIKFRAEGNSLFADVPEKSPAFKSIVDGIKGGTILGRSMGFFGRSHPSNPTPGKIAPKHLGFLGGAAAGIPGLPALAAYFEAHPESTLTFSADDVLEVGGDPAPAVVFEAAPTAVITFADTPDTPALLKENAVTDADIAAREAQIAERERAATEREATFAATEKAARETRNAATVETLVGAAKVLPADKDDLIAAFNAIDDGEVIAFASDAAKAKASPVSIIAGIMAKGGNVVPVNQPRTTPTGDAPVFSADKGELDKVRSDRMAKYGK